MNFNNNTYQQQSRRINLNTNIMRSYSDNYLMEIKAWNQQLSIAFDQSTGLDANGVRQYGGQGAARFSTSLTYDNAMALYDAYEETLKPSIKNGEPCTISVEVMGQNTGRRLITIGYDGTQTYIKLTWNITEDGVSRPEDTLVHPFKQRDVYIDYNAETGTPGTIRKVEAELDKFMDIVGSIRLLSSMVNHGIRYDNMVRASYANNRNAGERANYGGGQYNGGNNYQNSNSSYGNYNSNSGGGNGSAFYNVPDVGADELPFN